ncbi:MAG: hypothetical protein K6C38_09685, partial [Saccharofermentans sp.]|nr:hypothetical protein [Saccharofermentans sp.]
FCFQTVVALCFSNPMPSVRLAMPLLREYPTDYLDSTSEFRSETPFLECILSGIYPESNLVFHSTN